MKKLILIAFGTLILSSCGSSNPAITSVSLDSLNAVPNSSLTPGKQLSSTKLGGTWDSECTKTDDSPLKMGAHLEHYTFYTDGIAIDSTTFSDADCKHPEIAMYTFLNGVLMASDLSGNVFSTSYDASSIAKVEFIPLSSAIVSSFNDGNDCGNSHWQLNQPFDVDGTSCAVTGAAGSTPTTKVTYTLGADEQTLSFTSCELNGKCEAAVSLRRH